MGPFAGVGEFAFFDVLFIHFPNRVYWVLLKTLKFYFLWILDIRIGHMEFVAFFKCSENFLDSFIPENSISKRAISKNVDQIESI